MGEPKHATPPFIQQAMVDAIYSTPSGLAAYPATAGEPKLREACCQWLQRRYGLSPEPGHPGAAGEWLARGAVRAGADRGSALAHRAAGPAGGVPQPFLPNLRRCGPAGRGQTLL